MKRNTGIYMAPGSSARRSQRQPTTGLEAFAEEWKTHVVILLLAVFIWWTLKQGIENTTSIENRSRLEAVLDRNDRDLNSRFIVFTQPPQTPVLRATGPQKELIQFEELLHQRDKGAIYRFIVTHNDVNNLKPDSERRVYLSIPLSRFRDEVELPALREVSVEFANPDISVSVVLEEKTGIPAAFDTDGTVSVPDAYRANVAVKTDVIAFGPWSRLKPHNPDARGQKKFKLVTKDLGPEIVAALKDKTPEDARAWLATPISLKLGIQPVEGIEFRDKDGENLDAVSVEVTLTEKEGFVLERRDIPVDVLQPHWMLQKHVEVTMTRGEHSVELLVDQAKRQNFLPENVRLVLDLRTIQPSVGQPDWSNPAMRVATVSVPLRLEVNREKLPYRIPESLKATEDRFAEYDLTLTWKE
ncbi:MAG: hypothetical protein L6Q71_09910 [Planctomycetes bacterium]|nr:hypothetical protein [Planctomycetota bacterium]NUQ35658.1 hypothetical protein [Planctomycetaceae bacterium]